MRIGSLKNSDARLITQSTIGWSHRIKILGIYFTADKAEMIKLNYKVLLSKISKITESWFNRDLTLIGKTLVINTLVSSQYIYYFMNMYTATMEIYNEIYKSIKKYLWGNTLAYDTLVQPYEEGGLKLVDPKAKNISLKAKWFKEIFSKESISKNIAESFLPLPPGKILEVHISPQHVVRYKNTSIWFDIWYAWSVAVYKPNCDKDATPYQMIWYNSEVLSNGNLIACHDYMSQGIWYFKDLVNPVTNTWYTFQELCCKYGIPRNFIKYIAL